MSRRPYIRKVKANLWLGQRRYVIYMIRELTSLFVGLYCAVLVVGLLRLSQGRAAWDGFLAALSAGAIGGGRMADVGPAGLQVGLVAGLEMAVVAGAVCWEWRRILAHRSPAASTTVTPKTVDLRTP